MLHALLLAASVFLNGVNIDGVKSQAFEKCKSVRIDDRGDVQLVCPGYQVEAAPQAKGPAVAAASVAAAPAKGPKRWWLVTESANGGAQFDIDVFVNSKWIRKLRSGDDQVVIELTKFIAPGPNKLLLMATKKLAAGANAGSASAWTKVIVGEGDSGADTVVLDNPAVELKRTGAETNDVNEEFTVQGR